MLGEFNNLPVSIPADPEHRDDVSSIPTRTEKHFDWPNDLIDRIKQVMGMPCSTPSAPEFKFEISEEAMQQKHNLATLEKYEFNLGKALNAQHDSPLGPGMEFRPPDVFVRFLAYTPCDRIEQVMGTPCSTPSRQNSSSRFQKRQ